MHRIMVELHQDHIHLSRLLNMLTRHVKVLLDDGDPDFSMMIDIVDYIRNYSDSIHHPKEDVVYSQFKKISNDGIYIVDNLMDEHHKIPKVTIAFQQVLDGVLNGALIISRDELSEKITNFIDIQWAHLNLEEEKLFPLINSTLQESDWEKIVLQITKEQEDPLFGEQVEKRYQSLYEMVDFD